MNTNSLKYVATSAPFFLAALLPLAASAQIVGGGDLGDAGTFIVNFSTFLSTVVVPLIYSLAFLVFVWGVFVYFIAGSDNEDKRAEGKNLMIYAIIGFLAITVLWGIVNFFVATLGLGGGAFEPVGGADGGNAGTQLPAPTN